jgi:hypothetical protein
MTISTAERASLSFVEPLTAFKITEIASASKFQPAAV